MLEMDVKLLGQVFTPKHIVSDMLGLMENNGRVLEPSCGGGAFSDEIEGCVAIEIDETKAPDYAIKLDFFKYPVEEKFDTIIGNPPYVRFQDISDETKELLDMEMFDERTNLYLFFIYKSILHLNDGGELIFITPRDFLKATSAIELNKFIYKNGTITDIIDLGDKPIFKDYSPNVIIFRFQKGDFSRTTNIVKNFKNINGQLLFVNNDYSINFNDLFYVKVGGVSGADKIFTNEEGNMDFVFSKTRTTGNTKKMFYNVESDKLLPHKDRLLKRKIKKFNEDNWYQWGRVFHENDKERIYVNCKTRIENPFFTHNCKSYDGSVLAVFPKFEVEDMNELVTLLNEVDWNELGFVCDGRFLFSQKSLENCVLPEQFEKFLSKI